MTTIDALVLLVISGALGFVLDALRFRRELRAVTAERDEARQTLALLTALPAGHVCTEQVFYTRHFYDGSPECRRCGKPSPYKFTRIAPGSVRVIYGADGITSAEAMMIAAASETAGSAEEDK